MEAAKVSYPSDVDFFDPVQKYLDEEKPERLRGIEGDPDLDGAASVYLGLQETELNFQMRRAMEYAYPRSTTNEMRKEGLGEYVDLTRKCRVYLKEQLSKDDYKSFNAAFRFWEIRHRAFIKSLPEKARQVYENMKGDRHLNHMYENRWGFQKTNFVVGYLAQHILVTAHLEAIEKLNIYHNLKQRENQTCIAYYNTVLNHRKGLREELSEERRPTDSEVVARIVQSLTGRYGEKLDGEDYTKWTLQYLETRLKQLDTRQRNREARRQELRATRNNQQPRTGRNQAPSRGSGAPNYPRPKPNAPNQFARPPQRPQPSSSNQSGNNQGKRNADNGNNSNSGGDKSAPRQRILKCYNCQQLGHISSECKLPQRKRPKPVFAILGEDNDEHEHDEAHEDDSDEENGDGYDYDDLPEVLYA